ncbi:hypothetical protein [Saccharopolyspora spinosa]|uniref:hypothetical protein n=1 Tax=Saccharopolyspora spinosa TaxID=60894 RepID=UPI0002DA5E3E|nr:hypothetical protein [Saccharopolyspora spinosa]
MAWSKDFGVGGDGAADQVGKVGHAEVDGHGACGHFVELGEFLFGSGEADFESLDFAEPSFALGFSGIRQSVV